MTLDAIAAVEALGCAPCTLTATPPAGVHDVAVNGRRMQALGEAAGDAALCARLVAIGARLVAHRPGVARLAPRCRDRSPELGWASAHAP